MRLRCRRTGTAILVATAVLIGPGCTGSGSPSGTTTLPGVPQTTGEPPSGPTATNSPPGTAAGTTRPAAPTTTAPRRTSPQFSASAAVHTVQVLAGRIGPREASSAAYRRAAAWVE